MTYMYIVFLRLVLYLLNQQLKMYSCFFPVILTAIFEQCYFTQRKDNKYYKMAHLA